MREIFVSNEQTSSIDWGRTAGLVAVVCILVECWGKVTRLAELAAAEGYRELAPSFNVIARPRYAIARGRNGFLPQFFKTLN